VKALAKKVFHVLVLLAALLFASELIVAALLYFSGTVDRRKTGDLVKVVRGKLESEAPAEAEEAKAGERTEMEIQTERELERAVENWQNQRAEQEREIAEAREALESMRRELERDRAEIDAKWEQLIAERNSYEEQMARELAARQAEGFKRAVETYSQMDAEDVAKLLYGLEDEKVVDYLEAFKTRFAAEVLTEMTEIDQKAQPRAPGEGRVNRAARLQQMISGGDADPAPERPETAANG